MSTRYLIVFQPRSGSTYLTSALHNPEKGCVSGFEIFSRSDSAAMEYLTVGEFRDFGPAVKRELLSRFFAAHKDKAAAGCKVAPYQINDDVPGFFLHAQELCQRIIFLYRANPIEAAVSQLWALERARQGQLARLVRGEENTFTKLTVKRDEFRWYVTSSIVEAELIMLLAELCRVEKLLFSYEEFFLDVERSLATVQQFLGLDALAQSELIKIRPKNIMDSVNNYADLVKWSEELGLSCDLSTASASQS